MPANTERIRPSDRHYGEIGAETPRLEDGRLVTGHGRFVDDMALPDMAHAYVVRSPHAHARIRRIDSSAAAVSPGVLLVLTGTDAAADGLAPLQCLSFPSARAGTRFHRPAQPVLVSDKARHVGDRVALIVAETLAQAKDAAERLLIEYEPFEAVTLSDACEPGAPKVWDEAESNVSFELESGAREPVEAAFGAAAHVTRIAVRFPAVSANALEPRGALAYADPISRRLTLVSSTQNPFRTRQIVADTLGLSRLDLRVKALDVGGSFGMKGQTYPEDVLVVWAARRLQRPVKWTADRSESIASDMHGRGQIAEAALALDDEGHILAFRTSVASDLGAYLSGSGGVPPHNAGISYPGPYHIPLIHARVRGVFTNTAQLGPYRGSAKPEATFVLERLMDKAAREMGIDPVALRRRNLIPPRAMPYATPGGYVYDSGDFERVLDTALALADWNGFGERRRESELRGLRRGIGLAMHCQRAGTASERMEIRVDQTGAVALHVGTFSTGQGHETMFAQMASGWLGIPLDRVRVVQGDTDQNLFGRGSFAQRSMSAGGSALRLATDEVLAKARRIGAWMLEAAEDDLVFERGAFRVAGTDRAVAFAAIAQKAYAAGGLPQEFGIGLDAVAAHPGPNTFPNGCMICEVEVDPETGVVRVDRLVAVDDVGNIVNPLTLAGQLHGSIAQGLGEALLEQLVYEPGSGQLLTGTFMDYAMPRAKVMPSIQAEHVCVPTTTNPLGVKGGSEAGNVGAPPAIVNAIVDALAPLGVADLPLPATAERVWQALRAGPSGTPADSV